MHTSSILGSFLVSINLIEDKKKIFDLSIKEHLKTELQI